MHPHIPVSAAEALLRLAVLALYLGASLLYLRPLVAEHPRITPRLSAVSAVLAVALHTVVLGLLTAELRRPPIGDLSEALLVCAWLVGLSFLFVEPTLHQPVLGGFMLPVATFLYTLGLAGPTTAPPEGTDFANPWFQVHVAAFFIAYTAFSLSFCTGLMYLILAREIRRKRMSRFFLKLPSLDVLDRASYRAVLVGFPFVALGFLSGVVWGGTERHQWWHWDPKIVGAALGMILYFAYLVMRRQRGWRGERAALLAIVGFAVSVFTLVGGSLLSPGGHGF